MSFEAGTIPTAEEFADRLGALIVKSADESVTSSTALQDDDELLFAGAANTAYRFRLVAFVTGSINGDIKFGFTFPTGAGGATITWMGYGVVSTATTQADALHSAGYVASTTADQTLTFNAHGNGTLIIAEGYIEFGSTAGNLILRWAQGTSNATATIVKKGSSLEYKAA